MATPTTLRSAQFETRAKKSPDGTKVEKVGKHINWFMEEGTDDLDLMDSAAAASSKSISVFIKDAARKAARQVLANEQALIDANKKAE